MREQCDIRLEVVSNPIYLCAVREMMGMVAKRIGFSESQASKITLAVDEALANVMNHGYDRRLDGRIWLGVIRVDKDSGELEAIKVVIEDEGRQVDPETIKGRDLEDIRPGGLGVHIIRQVMDSAIYERRDTRGMRLTLVKRVGPVGYAELPRTTSSIVDEAIRVREHQECK